MAALDGAHMLIGNLLLQLVILTALGRWLRPLTAAFMEAHGLVDTNYRGQSIPSACGLLLWFLLLAETLLVTAMTKLGGIGGYGAFNEEHYGLFMGYSMSLHAVAFLGFMDDAIGHKKVKGIAGHWRQWKEHRRVSTGLLKAVGTAAAAAVFTLQLNHESLALWSCQTLLLLLMTNGMNLLDLRPGRAIKSFLVMAAFIVPAGVGLFSFQGMESGELNVWLAPFVLPMLIGAFVLLGSDLLGKLMIGDTGANMLGFAAGCWMIVTATWVQQAFMLTLLVLLHVITWRYSLSRLIESNRLLHWFDLLGRRGRV